MYEPEERLIYRYSDGERDRVADPLAIEATYLDLTSGLNVRGLNQQLRSENRRVRVRAAGLLLPAIRRTFDVVEYDESTGRGLPLAETHALLDDFFSWKARIKSRYRVEARFAAVYGLPPGRPLEYEMFCGLAFNLDACAALAGGLQVARGIATALSGVPHPSIVAAIADRESQVEGVADAIEAERLEAEALAQPMGGGR